MERNVTYLIVGGGVAGTTSAQTIRQNDAAGVIAIVSEEPHRLYSRVMLSKPNFFLGKMPFDRVWLKDEKWYSENRVELIAGRKAIRLDTAGKTVSLDNGDNIRYEKLLLAVGGRARAWGIEDAGRKGVFYLRTLDDARAIMAAVKSSQQAAAIGGGFVSFEMCDMLRTAGIEVTLIIREAHYWEPLLDETSGKLIEAALEKGGVKILKKSEVSRVAGEDAARGVILGDGTEIPCQMIIVGIGVFCPLEWIKQAGVDVNRGVLANEYLETNVHNVWAAGDAAEFNDLVLGERIQLGNWVNAQMQGRAAGLNMTGKKEPFRLVSFYTTQGFGITIAFAGDVRPDGAKATFSRGSFASGSYARIMAKDGEITGATLINRTHELSAVSKLIEKDFKVAGHEKELTDGNFDLKNLIR